VLAGPDGIRMLEVSEQSNELSERTAVYIAIRTRFFDDFVARAMSRNIRQCVLVAAGMDTRAFRLSLSPDSTVYELDQPEALAWKEQTLAQVQPKASCRRITVGVDLRQKWLPALTTAGFDPTQPSVWVVEGLLYYLTDAHVLSLLHTISQASAPGSRLGADLVSTSFFSSPFTKPALEMLAKSGMPWQSGSDDPESLLAACGWRATVRQPGEDGLSYGRWRYPVAPRQQRELPHSFLVEAVRE
jgi:methyltransferase (TIGR00027 family)